MEISVICVAAFLCRNSRGDGYDAARIAVGAAASRTIRVPKAEACAMSGGGDAFAEAARLAAEQVTPISDVRSSARYRKLLVAALVERALNHCATTIGKGGR